MFRKVLIVACAVAFSLTIFITDAAAQQKYIAQQALKVTTVFAGGPAWQQGLEAEDMILTVNGNPIRSGQDLRFYLGQAGYAATMEVRDWRTGNINLMTVYPEQGKIGIDGFTAAMPNDNGGGGGTVPPYSPYARRPTISASSGYRPIPPPGYRPPQGGGIRPTGR